MHRRAPKAATPGRGQDKPGRAASPQTLKQAGSVTSAKSILHGKPEQASWGSPRPMASEKPEDFLTRQILFHRFGDRHTPVHFTTEEAGTHLPSPQPPADIRGKQPEPVSLTPVAGVAPNVSTSRVTAVTRSPRMSMPPVPSSLGKPVPHRVNTCQLGTECAPASPACTRAVCRAHACAGIVLRWSRLADSIPRGLPGLWHQNLPPQSLQRTQSRCKDGQ